MAVAATLRLSSKRLSPKTDDRRPTTYTLSRPLSQEQGSAQQQSITIRCTSFLAFGPRIDHLEVSCSRYFFEATAAHLPCIFFSQRHNRG